MGAPKLNVLIVSPLCQLVSTEAVPEYVREVAELMLNNPSIVITVVGSKPMVVFPTVKSR